MSSFGSGGENKIRLLGRRMFIISAAKAVVVFGIVGRLISLQINESKKYKTLSDKNRFREWKFAPPRGTIKDYFGKEIASNKQVYQLHIIPENTENIETLFFRLKTILNLTDKDIFRLKRKILSQKPWDPIIVSDNLTWSEFSKINLFLHELQGVEPIVSVARIYHENSASHIIGYVSKISKEDLRNKSYLANMNAAGMRVGKTGLENKLDSEVIGSIGYKRYEVNAFGKRIREISIDQGKPGKTFKTTLDLELQDYSQKLLENKAGSICVMDIYRGDIVTMVSSPVFDPNKFVHGINKKDWKELINHRDKPLVNKAISGLYPPGSTIKMLVTISALENDIVNPKKVHNCTGFIELYGEKFHCWKKKGHGYVSLSNAIKQSCDTYFYEVSRLLGVDRLNETARKFGLGDIVLKNFFDNEKKGIVPSTKWKKEAIGQNWYLGETLITGIGQGYIQTTPLQLTLMTAQLANGGNKIYPTIIPDNTKNIQQIKSQMNNNENFSTNHPSLVRNKENVKFVLDAMFRSTNEIYGTSYKSRIEDPKYQFAGKTGTAQVKRITEAERELDLKPEQIPYEERDHAWFIAFGPYKNPRYALTVFVEHGGSGSSKAAPIAKKLFKKLIDRHEEREKIRINDRLIS